jgi:hypothetical protein
METPLGAGARKKALQACLACLAGAVGCSSSNPPLARQDAGSMDSGHGSDATLDAKMDAPPACPQADGPESIAVATKAHLTEAAPFVNVEVTVPKGCWASVKVQMTASSDCSGAPPAGQNWPNRLRPVRSPGADQPRGPRPNRDVRARCGDVVRWERNLDAGRDRLRVASDGQAHVSRRN